MTWVRRALALSGALLLGAGKAQFTPATAPYAFSFPRDHGAHMDYQSEWWYFTGHLVAANGRHFGYELTFFRFGLAPGDPPPARGRSRWRGNQTYAAHFAVTDEDAKTFFYRARYAREALDVAGASSGSLAVHVGDWSLTANATGGAARERMRLSAARDGEAIALTLDPLKAPAIHGSGGISRKAACATCASHYYSYTRIATRGSLTVDGTRLAVSGISWMDHEYASHELAGDEAGWDWFSLQLDDGRDLMLYLLRRKDGSVTPESSGSIVAPDGRVTHLALHDFTVTVRGNSHWHSPHTGASYPSLWELVVPRARLWAALAPSVADQELALDVPGLTYWEGSVSVTDVATGGKRLGRGYVELTGYAQPLSF